MASIPRFVRTYPVVVVTVAVAVVGGALALGGLEPGARWLISLFSLAIAAQQAWGMVRDLVHGKAGIDILAIAAIVATVVVGEYWASIVIVLMLSGGEALEDYAAGRARRELTSLLEMAPVRAHRVDDGRVVDVDTDQVQIGDELVVRPGEVVPVDGTMTSGVGVFDESALTGESLPVEHAAGEAVLSGSVNGPAAVHVTATARAADSQYQRIVDLVREAAESRSPMVRLADRYAVPFTLVAFAIAGLAWALSGDSLRFAEVLVVATPCPLIIAAPVAFVGGMSRAARGGIIVKGGGTLEQLARVRTAVFDKTGTLTHGTPEVLDVLPAPGFDAPALLGVVAGAEQYSAHVLAHSLVEAAGARGVDVPGARDVVEVTGAGVQAVVEGRAVLVGKHSWLASCGVDVPEVGTGQAGRMSVWAAVDGAWAGEIQLGDRLRGNTVETLTRLRALGVGRIMMLTGDSAPTAEHVAAEAGIDEVRAECLPQDKVEAVRSVTQRPVLMVGDGVNDAPVLAVADVGIAMGAKGSSAAGESADAVIMLDDISRVARAVSIGRRTLRVATQSIWIGIGLSLALMVVATFGLLPAVAGAGMQELVDLAAILNALRSLTAGRGAARPGEHEPRPGRKATAGSAVVGEPEDARGEVPDRASVDEVEEGDERTRTAVEEPERVPAGRIGGTSAPTGKPALVEALDGADRSPTTEAADLLPTTD